MTQAAARYCAACGTHLEVGAGPGGRPRCPACGLVVYADPKVAVGVVVEHEGGILLVRRNHEPMLGRWSFPSGFVDAGEALPEAAVREVREECGVDVRLERLLGVFSRRDDRVVFVAYAGSVTGGTPRAGDEAFEVALFAPDALPAPAFPHDEAVLRAWRSGRGLPVD